MTVKVTVLAGGVGGAKFLLGLRRLLEQTSPGAEIAAVVNIGDDAWMHGLKICPDLDSCMYTLGGAVDAERGWGQRDETYSAWEELKAYGVEPTWFTLGDRDIGTHLVRSQMLAAGYPLTDVTEALCARWQPRVRLLPVSDDRSETHVVITDPVSEERTAIHFQEWWVKHRAKAPAHSFAFLGSEKAKPTPQALAAIAEADAVLLAPSNPVVSIGALLAIPGIRAALRETKARVVGLSPIIDGKPLRGMADACLAAIGVESSAEAVGSWYGARLDTGILDGWLVHESDQALIPGVRSLAVPLLMNGPDATAAMARRALELAGVAL
ncbi:LPPG domain protein containing protein [Segniliparus rotundus DSM 44985]|uniref:LPPG domain protein containing protein n=1 Tax=Segniliparus rotundus (strain ATCC BAA-972 / CDC 1076 / CIP 108378 / DSM 44985 / JCM 13578) TaxID=640132 RepID=D6ZCD5_SEGRD|nr:2-phospho-L-lactate transferase [Segniliparus rotundus]ADG99104.1 LPPG domain protein containing protein [Segniliparus rotundus DSM 44985]